MNVLTEGCSYERRGNVAGSETYQTVVVSLPSAPPVATTVQSLTAGLLPSSDLLLRACRGHRVIGGPLLWFARDLAVLHERRLIGRGGGLPEQNPAVIVEIERRRTELVMAVDDWIIRTVPQHRLGATLHTETIGSVIDRLAGAAVCAHHSLMTMDANDDVLHGAWHHLAELADGYDDLVRDVLAGRRRLPAW
ncbi:DUF4254 domain-containing protein [Nocardia stercoris]|uniref:DUF4254 domain-containing protein n=1 Tax=Nocardia stercoris TaxID=2483361 RepID=A0A3M2L4F3_9NOCA|nr:DUF4254 domain-containing protein [Nocardia stercoris]RMI31856.1 DUF4254 domain-containing protein [Nocardia stercoris]